MKILDEYFALQEKIYEYFGYKEDWVVIPIDDARDYYWELHQEKNGGGYVSYALIKENLNVDINNNKDVEVYENDIYTQRFLPKWVYEGKDYTMIVVDTHTDGNKFLQIFDNKKRIE